MCIQTGHYICSSYLMREAYFSYQRNQRITWLYIALAVQQTRFYAVEIPHKHVSFLFLLLLLTNRPPNQTALSCCFSDSIIDALPFRRCPLVSLGLQSLQQFCSQPFQGFIITGRCSIERIWVYDAL